MALASSADYAVVMIVLRNGNVGVVLDGLDLTTATIVVATGPLLVLGPSSQEAGVELRQGVVERFHWERGGRGTRTRRGTDRGLGSGIESDARRSCR